MLEEMIETVGVSKDGSKTIKSIIYNLATTGNLVPQIPKETQSPEVLKLIKKDEVLHEIKSGWLNLKLSACAEIYNGNSTSAAEKALMEINESGLNYIATKDVGYGFQSIEYETGLKIVTEKNNFKIAPVNSLLICLEGGSAGKKMGILSEDVVFGNKLFAVVCKEWIQPKFLLMYFLSSKFQIDFRNNMSGIIGGISKANFSNIHIPIPPLAEQNRIIDKVESLIAICDELEVAQADQRRFNGLLRSSAIDAVSTAQTPEELQIAWNRIQDHWEVLTGPSDSVESIRLLVHDLATRGNLSGEEIFEVVVLKDIAQINYGYTESAKHTEVGPRFLRITDIQQGKVDWNTVPYCPISSADEEKHLLKDGDLVFARTGATTGKSFLLNNPPRSVCASYLIRVRPDVKKVLPEYLYLYFQSGQYWVDVKSGMSGTAQGGFNSSKLGALAIRIPDLATQARIVKKTNELLQVCEDLDRSLFRRQILAEKFARSVVSISA